MNVCYWSKTQLGYSILNLNRLNSVAMPYSTWTSTGSCRFTGPSLLLPCLSKRFFIVVSCLVSSSVRVRSTIVSAHRRILGMASVVCVLVKICVSSISLYKQDTDKLTAPFESALQFTLVCTVSDSKTVPGCHYNLCSNHSFVLTD